MLFTREPIIETVITARSGFRLVVRNSKYPQEELLVDALEIVSFGSALFYRCTERPKAFLVPVSDYDVSEVRETRLVLKHLAQTESKNEPRERESRRHGRDHRDRDQSAREVSVKESTLKEDSFGSELDSQPSESLKETGDSNNRNDRRRDRRRGRRRRGEARGAEEDTPVAKEPTTELSQLDTPLEPAVLADEEPAASQQVSSKGKRAPQKGPMQLVSALIPPPPTLVSDIFRYERLDNEGVRQAVKLADLQASQGSSEISEPSAFVAEARSHLMEALDFYAGDDLARASDEDEV